MMMFWHIWIDPETVINGVLTWLRLWPGGLSLLCWTGSNMDVIMGRRLRLLGSNARLGQTINLQTVEHDLGVKRRSSRADLGNKHLGISQWSNQNRQGWANLWRGGPICGETSIWSTGLATETSGRKADINWWIWRGMKFGAREFLIHFTGNGMRRLE